jgi:hypothetical protein
MALERSPTPPTITTLRPEPGARLPLTVPCLKLLPQTDDSFSTKLDVAETLGIVLHNVVEHRPS